MNLKALIVSADWFQKSFIFIPVNFKKRGAMLFCYQFDSFYMLLQVSLVHTIPEDSLSGPWVESDPEKVRATESWTQTGMSIAICALPTPNDMLFRTSKRRPRVNCLSVGHRPNKRHNF